MKKYVQFSSLLVIGMVIFSCNKDSNSNKQDDTVVFTVNGDATNVTSDGATFTFTISVADKITVSDKGVCYSSQDSKPTTKHSVVSKGSGAGSYTVTLTGLTEDTNYYLRPYAIVDETTYYGTVSSFKTLADEGEGIVINGIRWATCNLGEDGEFVANPEDYGALFQWGRRADGHQSRTSPSYPANNNTIEEGAIHTSELDANGQVPPSHPAYGKFVKSNENFDWRIDQDSLLWNTGTKDNPVKSENDPCPCGWRIPTKEEWSNLWWATDKGGGEQGELNGVKGYFYVAGSKKLFLPNGGYRDGRHGGMGYVETRGLYWSSTAIRLNGFAGAYSFQNVVVGYYSGWGLSIRCVAEEK